MVDRKGPHTLPPSAAAQAPSAGNVPSRSPGSRSKPLYSIVVIRTYYAITPRLEKACFFILNPPTLQNLMLLVVTVTYLALCVALQDSANVITIDTSNVVVKDLPAEMNGAGCGIEFLE